MTSSQAPQPMEIVRKRISHLRALRGWTNERLSDLLAASGVKLSVPTLTFIQIGRRKIISVDELYAFAHVFGVSIDVLAEEPKCTNCFDAPPPGYSCLTCGKT